MLQKIGAIAIKSFALLVCRTVSAMAQDAVTPFRDAIF